MPDRNKYVFFRPAQANFDWAVPGLRDAESVGPSVADLLAEVESEWAEQEHMHPVHVSGFVAPRSAALPAGYA